MAIINETVYRFADINSLGGPLLGKLCLPRVELG